MKFKGTEYLNKIGYTKRTECNLEMARFHKPDPQPFIDENGEPCDYYSEEVLLFYVKNKAINKRVYLYKRGDILDTFYESTLSAQELEACYLIAKENGWFNSNLDN